MAENLVDEIKATEVKAATIVRDTRADAAQRQNEAVSNSENRIKEARQMAAREFRSKVAAVEKEAEAKAVELVKKGEAEAKAFFDKHMGKVSEAANAIAEEVMVRYVRS